MYIECPICTSDHLSYVGAIVWYLSHFGGNPRPYVSADLAHPSQRLTSSDKRACDGLQDSIELDTHRGWAMAPRNCLSALATKPGCHRAISPPVHARPGPRCRHTSMAGPLRPCGPPPACWPQLRASLRLAARPWSRST